jgi:hypothetical protein
MARFQSIQEIRHRYAGKWYFPKWYRRYAERRFRAQRRKFRTGVRVQGER